MGRKDSATVHKKGGLVRDFTLIRIDGEKVCLKYYVEQPDLTVVNYTLESKGAPDPLFRKTMHSLNQYIADLVEVSEQGWDSDIAIKDVRFNLDDDMVFVSFVAIKPMANSSEPFEFTTPQRPVARGVKSKPEESGGPSDEEADGDNKTHYLPLECVKILARLCKRAEDYIEGKRAQLTLDLEVIPNKHKSKAQIEDERKEVA
jgi:hypothetical protein